MKQLGKGYCLVPIFLLAPALIFAQGQVTELTVPGNLQPENPLPCVAGDATTSEHTPVDILHGASLCLGEDNYQLAAELILIGSIYARFDMQRVTDRSAHQALNAMLVPMMSGLTQDNQTRLFGHVGSLNPPDPRHLALCQHLRAQGPPQYRPTYMIQHGMGAFLGQGNEGPLVARFDADHEFEAALRFGRCQGDAPTKR